MSIFHRISVPLSARSFDQRHWRQRPRTKGLQCRQSNKDETRFASHPFKKYLRYRQGSSCFGGDASIQSQQMKTPPLGCAVLLALVITSAALLLFAQTPPPAPSSSPKESPPTSADYDLRWGVKIPMRDKVELNATLYLPKTAGGSMPRTPVIFTLTPYISDSYHARAAYFASHGYAFALVDVRGRGNSGGEFEPFVNDPRDGHDLVEWFAKQPFCDGKVAMWGGSYAGFDQWATAK